MSTTEIGPGEKLVTVEHGVSSITRPFPKEYTFGQLKADTSVRAALGTAETLRALVDGLTMRDTAVIPDGETVLLETAAAEKHTA